MVVNVWDLADVEFAVFTLEILHTRNILTTSTLVHPANLFQFLPSLNEHWKALVIV